MSREPSDIQKDRIGIGSAGTWSSLRLLNSYRILVASVLLIGFWSDVPGIHFGLGHPLGFHLTAAAYLLAALLFATTIYKRRPTLGVQAHVHLYADVILLVLAAHLSGGIDSGLSVLLVAPIAGAGLVLPARHALLYAALATLLLLASEIILGMDRGFADINYTQAASLGTVLFITALFAAIVSRRSAASEAVAQRRAQDVRKLSALNESIIQHMESGIVVVDPHDQVMLTNSSAEHLLGRKTENTSDSLAAAAPGIARALAQWRRTGDAPIGTLANEHDASRRLQVQFTDLGELGTLISLEDAAVLEERLQQLKLASLGRLTASVAHEVRNPVGAIQHSAQLLAESDHLNAQDQHFIRIVIQQCARMNSMVENILQLSRPRTTPTEQIELDKWVAAVLRELRDDQVTDHGKISLHLPAAPLPAHMDPEHLRQILRNLCENAARHGRSEDGGPVTVTVRVYRDAAGWPSIAVSDDGTPIPEEQAQSMFEPFYTTSGSGTGLGLFLARELCEANHGSLRYHHDRSGNHFRITLTGPRK